MMILGMKVQQYAFMQNSCRRIRSPDNMLRIRQSLVCTHSATRVGCRLHRLLHPLVNRAHRYTHVIVCAFAMLLIPCANGRLSAGYRWLIHRWIYPDVDNDPDLSSFLSTVSFGRALASADWKFEDCAVRVSAVNVHTRWFRSGRCQARAHPHETV